MSLDKDDQMNRDGEYGRPPFPGLGKSARELRRQEPDLEYRGLTQEEIAEAVLGGEGPLIRTAGTDYPTEAARYIAETLMPEFLALFLEKNKGYGNMHGDLGLRAQYVDIHRKVGKLRRAWWDGKPIGPEQPREVVMDLIGHLFLALELLDGDDPEQGEE